jgi:hypothetical protein
MASINIGDKVRAKKGHGYAFPKEMTADSLYTVKCISGGTAFLFDKDHQLPNEHLYSPATCSCPRQPHKWIVVLAALEKVPQVEFKPRVENPFGYSEFASPFRFADRYMGTFGADFGSPLFFGDKITTTTTKTSLMEITRDTIAMFFKGEPEKTLIETGLTDRDGTLTAEGRLIFLNWLFNQNKDKFFAEVVKPIADELKAKK